MPTELVDAVLGKSSDKLRAIEAAHNLCIDRSRELTAPTLKLKIRGSHTGVDAAIAALDASIERERHVEISISVESKHVGILLGKQGCTINAIQKSSGATLEIEKAETGAGEGEKGGKKGAPPHGDLRTGEKGGSEKGGSEGKKGAPPHGDERIGAPSRQKVLIRGNKQEVALAQRALEEVLQYSAEANETVEVEQSMMPLLIGKGVKFDSPTHPLFPICRTLFPPYVRNQFSFCT